MHITCHECGSNEHMSGYGLAAGPMGMYTICDCGELLEFTPDLEGIPDDHAERLKKQTDEWRSTVNAKRQAKGLPLVD